MSLAPTPSWRRTVGGGSGLGRLRGARTPGGTKFSPETRRSPLAQPAARINTRVPSGSKFRISARAALLAALIPVLAACVPERRPAVPSPKPAARHRPIPRETPDPSPLPIAPSPLILEAN